MFKTHQPLKGVALLAVASIAALSLTACGNADEKAADGNAAAPVSSEAPAGYDLDKIKADPAVEALVPEAIKKKGELTNGASVDYAPAEFFADDGKTPIGYDVQLASAIAKVMGLKGATTSHADFDSLIPQIGSKYDIEISSFTITKEREEKVNMISYAKVGFQYATAKGNPNKFNPAEPCGKTIGVQVGTAQEEYMNDLSKKCVADGKKAIDLKPSKLQVEISPKVASGQYDATVADSSVVGYIGKVSNGKIEPIGDVFDSALQGVVVSKNDEGLAKAVEAALQSLAKTGQLKEIMAAYGAGSIAVSDPQLNPVVE